MNKKGQVGPIGAIMLFLVFLILWFVWLGYFVEDVGESVILDNGLSGVEAFFFSNLNIAVLICMFLGMLGMMYFTSAT